MAEKLENKLITPYISDRFGNKIDLEGIKSLYFIRHARTDKEKNILNKEKPIAHELGNDLGYMNQSYCTNIIRTKQTLNEMGYYSPIEIQKLSHSIEDVNRNRNYKEIPFGASFEEIQRSYKEDGSATKELGDFHAAQWSKIMNCIKNGEKKILCTHDTRIEVALASLLNDYVLGELGKSINNLEGGVLFFNEKNEIESVGTIRRDHLGESTIYIR